MKTLILLAFVALISAQTPIPAKGLSLSFFSGYWYAVWEYSQYYNNREPTKKTCQTLNITVGSTSGTIFEQESYKSGSFNFTAPFTVLNNNAATWNVSGSFDYWVSYDPINSNWAVLGRYHSQEALIISRNPNISTLVLDAQITLLRGEGYNINSTNQFTLLSQNCAPLLE